MGLIAIGHKNIVEVKILKGKFRFSCINLY